MITSVLVANRGEIARRVFRSARELGLATVAVYSDADAASPHVAEADIAVRLPGNSPAETYLRGDLIIAAALTAGADAIHPGYGFLSENAGFARAVIEAGLTWIGPPPEAIDSMGSKIESKQLMAAAGVPTLQQLDPAQIGESDLPVLIKASAGGGGRGMRIVRELSQLPQELDSARTEAQSAFGDPTVFCEPYLATGRHLEVQVLADEHGTIWTVGERECSIQRRHQKVIEEAPSPLVQRIPSMRSELFDASRRAAAAVDYVGAGTVEFIADEDGRFFFLEMNTRLQVEHPVTEATTGLDLVRWQLLIAEGAELPDESPAIVGHSVEVRLYAEDPATGWQPQSGVVHTFSVPGVDAEFANPDRLRLDSGIVDGSVVGIHYDPMLAKVISWAPTRSDAARSLAAALAKTKIHGLRTNRDLLVRVLRHPAFIQGDTDTAFFDRHDLSLLSQPLAQDVGVAALVVALADAAENRESAIVQRDLPSGWRNVSSQPQRKSYLHDGEQFDIDYELTRSGLSGPEGIELISAQPTAVALTVDGLRLQFEVARFGDQRYVESSLGAVTFTALERFVDPASQVAAGSLLAPMPGTVIRVAAAVGDSVTAGQPLLWLEAMKMEHQILAPADGVVTEFNAEPGQQVEVGAILAVVDAEGESS